MTLDLTSEDGVDVFDVPTAVSSTVSSTESSEVEASSYMLEIVFRTRRFDAFFSGQKIKMQKMNDLYVSDFAQSDEIDLHVLS